VKILVVQASKKKNKKGSIMQAKKCENWTKRNGNVNFLLEVKKGK
jgi:hypothetical protein